MENGVIDKRQTELVNASWETISMRFKLIRRGKHKINGESFYKFETDHILFNLINYGFIEKEYIQKGNKQGFQNITVHDIKNALLGLDVKIIITNKHGITQITPCTNGL